MSAAIVLRLCCARVNSVQAIVISVLLRNRTESQPAEFTQIIFDQTLTPKPHSTGGKERLGRIFKMGNRYLRRLLYLGAIALVSARRRGEAGDDWLWKIIQRKKPKHAAIALATLAIRRGSYRAADTRSSPTVWRASARSCREVGGNLKVA